MTYNAGIDSIRGHAHDIVFAVNTYPAEVYAFAQVIVDFDFDQSDDNTFLQSLNEWYDTARELQDKYRFDRRYCDSGELNLNDFLQYIKEDILIERTILELEQE